MSVIIQGYQLREIALGVQVIKGPSTPPNSGSSATIATVAGGAVLITSMLGLVTTVLSGSTGQISLGTAPTTGTAETAGIASLTTVGGAEAGTWLAPQASSEAAGALVNGGHAGNVLYLAAAFVVSAGTITWTVGTATMTGQVKWYLTYVPLDTGATVS